MRMINTTIACGLALAISSAACDRGDRGEAARGHEGAPIRITGCLQKDPGVTTTFILTRVNEPTQSVGTSGTSADPSAVERERLREAKHAYRLEGDNDQLNQLVGKQVQVQGMIAEDSDLSKKQTPEEKRDVDTGDLAKIKVVTMAAVADACGDVSVP
jgi:hypothetical protein